MARLKVMRKRRGKSLQRKMIKYAELFNVDIAIIVREKATGNYEVFQPQRAENWPPAMEEIVRHAISRKNNIANKYSVLKLSILVFKV